jgi:hypothetical protein
MFAGTINPGQSLAGIIRGYFDDSRVTQWVHSLHDLARLILLEGEEMEATAPSELSIDHLTPRLFHGAQLWPRDFHFIESYSHNHFQIFCQRKSHDIFILRRYLLGILTHGFGALISHSTRDVTNPSPFPMFSVTASIFLFHCLPVPRG